MSTQQKSGGGQSRQSANVSEEDQAKQRAGAGNKQKGGASQASRQKSDKGGGAKQGYKKGS